MKNLDKYKEFFNAEYPEYADTEYSTICDLVNTLPDLPKALINLDSEDAKAISTLILPFIKIKNYKSQVPFPENLFDAIKLLIKIKNSNHAIPFDSDKTELFNELLSTKGIQLPTASAIFHFCSPSNYPIVDQNVQAACKSLVEEYASSFQGISVPHLPAPNTSNKNKLEKYKSFIIFLEKLKDLHNTKHATNYGFRDLDKALMIYGVKKLKDKADGITKC